MNSATSPYFSTLRLLPRSLCESDDIPLLGREPPQFPWADFTSQIAQALCLEQFQIEHTPFQWREAEQWLEGLHGQLLPLYISLATNIPPVIWIMSRRDISTLLSLLMQNSTEPLELADEEMEKSFYHFIAWEALSAIVAVDFDKSLTPQITDEELLPFEDERSNCLSCDITLSICGHQLFGRLIITEKAQLAWKEHYSQKPFDLLSNPQLAEKCLVTVRLEVGAVNLHQADWQAIKPGDFLLLDRCTVEGDLSSGEVLLTVNGVGLYRAEIGDGAIKILDSMDYREENSHG